MNAPAFNIEALPVTIKYVAEVPSKWDGDKKRTVDLWHVTITSKSGFHTFDYMTGLGLRKPTKQIHNIGYTIPSKPVKPTIADVLFCLVNDEEASDFNFADWCNHYGYSDDSIYALNTYKACLETATALRKHFDRDTLAAIRNHVQDM